jgi:hypothetical protein
MRRLIFLTVLFIPFFTNGQENNQKVISTDKRRFLVGINISPDYCFRTLKNSDNSEFGSIYLESVSEYEKPKFSYTAGLNICYNLTKQFAIEAGLQYSNKGYTYVDNDPEYSVGDMNDPRYGFVYNSISTSPITKFQLIYNFLYFDIPLRAKFYFGKNRLRFVTSLGVTANIFLKANMVRIYKYENGDKDRKTFELDHNYKPVNLSPAISAGIDYGISNKFSLAVEPTFRYGLINVQDYYVDNYLWNAGLNLSFYYMLK